MVIVRSAARMTLVTGGLLAAAAWVLGSAGVADGHETAIGVLNDALGGILVVLAWRFRRQRLALAALLLASISVVIQTIPGADHELERSALVVFAAVDLAVLAVVRDRPLWRASSLIWVGVIALQLWWAVVGIHYPATSALSAWLHRPLLTAGAALGAGLVVLAAFLARRTAYEAGLIWAVSSVTAALTVWGGIPAEALLFIAGQLALLASVIEDSYRLAYHDELTGLPGRRALREAMTSLSEPFAIAMADIDHFKRFNDRYGHDAGDQVLRMVADELARVGGSGRAFRYGGEEFTILFPGRTAAGVRDELERIRRTVEERRFALRSPDRPRTRPEKPKRSPSPPRRVTVAVSVGVADANSRRRTADAVLRAADRALYRAKHAGRNRVVAAGDRL